MLKRFIVLTALLMSVILAMAQTVVAPANMPVRVRGTIEKVEPDSIIVKERSGEIVTLARPADIALSEVLPLKLADIKPGSYVGSAAMPRADGTQLALEVLVFPESARGSGEGHYPWDLQPQSTMTNATVAEVAAAPTDVPGGQKLILKYKDGEKTIIVPSTVPVVTFKPGKEDEKVLVVPGAKVFIIAQVKDGKPTAVRMIVGRNGFAPPM